jgi:hypothetical protein
MLNPDLTAAIRTAFASGEFAKARELWKAYAGELRGALEGEDPAGALAEARQLLDWARLHANCLRAHAEAQLNETRIAARYAGPAAAPQTRIRTLL